MLQVFEVDRHESEPSLPVRMLRAQWLNCLAYGWLRIIHLYADNGLPDRLQCSINLMTVLEDKWPPFSCVAGTTTM